MGTNDPMDRDKFPGRPDSPDFWRLVEIVNQLDGRATEGPEPEKAFETTVPEIADLESVIYVARQRALRALDVNATTKDLARLAAVWSDGFMAGALFEQRKGKR